MNAVIDEDLHRSLAIPLSTLGFKVFDIRDHGLRTKPDEEIFKFAQKKKAVLFSGDLGFSNTNVFSLGRHYGIVVLRFPNELSTEVINEEVKRLLKRASAEDYKGNLIILSPGKIRIKRPIKPSAKRQ